MPRVQGIIQRLEHFTSNLSGSDEKTVLRLRHGKIREGAYKGTRKGRFKHWLAKPFLSKKARKERKEYLQAVTEAESKALAKALSADISKRSPIPYEVDCQVNVQDVKTVLEASKEDREKFARTVRQFVSSSASSSQLHTNPVGAAKKCLEQALMDRSIRHHDQIKELHKEAVEILDQQKKTKKSKRKPLVDGEPLLELKNVNTLKKQISALVEEAMLNLALFREAEEYAMKEQLADLETTPQVTITEERRLELLDDFVKSDKAQKAPRKSIALLAAQHMLAHGVEIYKADIPNLDSNQPPEKLAREEEALAKEIEHYRARPQQWSQQVAELLEQHQFKEARVVEDLARDSQTMKLLGKVREAFADGDWDKHLKKQRKKIKKGKNLKVQNHNQKKVHGQGPSLEKIRPQTLLDRIHPWRGNHTRVATTHAKQMISRPTGYDGNIQSKEAIVEQTLGMMQAKYQELVWDKNTSLLSDLRHYLEKNIHARRVEVTQPVVLIKRPLQDIPFDTSPVFSKEDQNKSALSPRLSLSSADDIPTFDLEKLETSSTDSGHNPDIGNMENFKDQEPDDVFESEPAVKDQNSPNELVEAEKEELQTKSVSEVVHLGNKDELPEQRSTSTSNSTKPEPTRSSMEDILSRQRINRYAQLVKPAPEPPPTPPTPPTPPKED